MRFVCPEGTKAWGERFFGSLGQGNIASPFEFDMSRAPCGKGGGRGAVRRSFEKKAGELTDESEHGAVGESGEVSSLSVIKTENEGIESTTMIN